MDTRTMGGAAHLAYFTLVQLLVYFDRSVLSGLLGSAEFDFQIDGFKSGLLGSGFMGGFVATSPMVALVAGARTAPWMCLGLAVWMMAALGTAVARTYSMLLLSRVVAGAGEAAYCTLAPPMIDDTAPEGRRSAYLAVYFSAIFLGSALGYAAQASYETWQEGRVIFLVEALMMSPLVAFIFWRSHRFHSLAEVGSHTAKKATGTSGRSTLTAREVTVTTGLELIPTRRGDGGAHREERRLTPPPATGGKSSGTQPEEEPRCGGGSGGGVPACTLLPGPPPQPAAGTVAPVVCWGVPAGRCSSDSLGMRSTMRIFAGDSDPCWRKVAAVLSVPIYVLLLLGYSACIFSLGGYAFWAPMYLEKELKFEKKEAGQGLGAVTMLSGLAGTVIGGLVLDAVTSTDLRSSKSPEGVRGRRATQVAFWCAAAAWPLCLLAVAAPTLMLFLLLLGLGMCFACMSTTPVNVAMMEAMPPHLRSLALGICTFAIHLLGDAVSPMLVGKVRVLTGSLVPGVWMLSLWTGWSVLCWGLAWRSLR